MKIASLEPVYYVTALSNFARGYDKYRRVYSKRGVPESTFPDRFFVLRENELSIGVRKAAPLLTKLGFPGNQLIAIRAYVPAVSLQANTRNGLGRVWPVPEYPVDAVFSLTGDADAPQLMPYLLEDAMADSFCLLQPSLISFQDLRPRSISFLPIAKGCQAACPFCFSEASVSADQKQGQLDVTRVKRVLRLARERGAERAVITGGGEPTLLREPVLLELIRECRAVFSKVVLITNGHRYAQMENERRGQALDALMEAGLTVLNISRHHHKDEVNARLMNLSIASGSIARTWAASRKNTSGLTLRFTCVLQRDGINNLRELEAFVAWAAGLGVPEICFKELYVSTSRESLYHSQAANSWCAQHQIPLALVPEFAEHHGYVKTDCLPWDAPVFSGISEGRPMRVAAYAEPSLFWERTHGIARSWNFMADGRCLASLEDRASEVRWGEIE